MYEAQSEIDSNAMVVALVFGREEATVLIVLYADSSRPMFFSLSFGRQFCIVASSKIPSCFVQVRSMISDFAVFITIVFMVMLDFLIGIPSQKLQVPSNFKVG